jgi:hypothetical protein
MFVPPDRQNRTRGIRAAGDRLAGRARQALAPRIRRCRTCVLFPWELGGGVRLILEPLAPLTEIGFSQFSRTLAMAFWQNGVRSNPLSAPRQPGGWPRAAALGPGTPARDNESRIALWEREASSFRGKELIPLEGEFLGVAGGGWALFLLGGAEGAPGARDVPLAAYACFPARLRHPRTVLPSCRRRPSPAPPAAAVRPLAAAGRCKHAAGR